MFKIRLLPVVEQDDTYAVLRVDGDDPYFIGFVREYSQGRWGYRLADEEVFDDSGGSRYVAIAVILAKTGMIRMEVED